MENISTFATRPPLTYPAHFHIFFPMRYLAGGQLVRAGVNKPASAGFFIYSHTFPYPLTCPDPSFLLNLESTASIICFP